MNGDTVVEVLLGSAHNDSDGDTLHHLIDTLTDSVGSNDLQVLVVTAIILTNLLAYELEVTLLLVLLVGR